MSLARELIFIFFYLGNVTILKADSMNCFFRLSIDELLVKMWNINMLR